MGFLPSQVTTGLGSDYAKVLTTLSECLMKMPTRVELVIRPDSFLIALGISIEKYSLVCSPVARVFVVCVID